MVSSAGMKLGATKMGGNFALAKINYTYKIVLNGPTAYTVFSPAYIRHVGPTSLQFIIPFDVGIVLIHKL